MMYPDAHIEHKRADGWMGEFFWIGFLSPERSVQLRVESFNTCFVKMLRDITIRLIFNQRCFSEY